MKRKNDKCMYNYCDNKYYKYLQNDKYVWKTTIYYIICIKLLKIII